jgi:hypothetical protein
VAHVLDKKLSGSLELDGDGTEGPLATVVFREGSPSKARTAEPHYLGMVLHTLGIIDDTKLNASLGRLAQERRPHGHILRDMGALNDEGLLQGLRVQLSGKLEPLFGLPPSTNYRFFENHDGLPTWGGPEVVTVDLIPILWSALQRFPPVPHVERALARVAPDMQMRVTARIDPARFRFSKRTADLVERMRATPLTVDQMIATGLADMSGARLLVYGLLLTKQIMFSAAEPLTPAPSRTPGAQAPPAPAISRSPTNPSALPRPVAEIRAAAASDPPSVAPARGSTAPASTTSAPPPGVALTPELVAVRQGIIDRVAKIGEEDYFQVLGLPRDASPGAVQQAYIALAKVWHPDRLAPQLFDVRDLSGKVFTRMTEARVTLTDPEKRAAYIAALNRGARPDRPIAARATNHSLEFQKAEVFLKKRQLDAAEEHCRRAREADPANADYLALLTWIELERDGVAQENVPKYLDAFDRALKMNERCERAYVYRATLYKRMNKPDKAYLDFKMAAEVNPKNIDAAREVILYKKRL